jgi:hypothetical protein
MGITYNNGRNAAAITSNSSLYVGIGTSSPGAIFDINIPNVVNTDLLRFSNSAGGSGDIAKFQYGPSGQFILNLLTNASANRNFGILNGNVGIGTSSPLYSVHVVKPSANAFVGVSNQGTSDGNRQLIMGFGGNGSETFATIKGTRYNVADDVNIAILGGNVGIGTTSPASGRKLTVAGGTQFTYGDNTGASFNIVPNANGQDGADFNLSYYTGTGYGPLTFTLSGSERMRINSAGYVLIGTSSSTGAGASRLQVTGSTAQLLISNTTPGHIALYTTGTDAYITKNTTSGSLLFGLAPQDGSSFTEQMRITSSGRVQVKQAGDTATDGFGLINSTYGNIWSTVNGGDNNFYFCYNYSTKGVINYSTGAYSALSDFNKKKDFENSTIGLNAILGLKPTLFRMKDEEDTEKHLGFIAQEVKEFLPQAYNESKNGENTFIGLTEMPIIAALVKSIQEQQKQIEELKSLIKK